MWCEFLVPLDADENIRIALFFLLLIFKSLWNVHVIISTTLQNSSYIVCTLVLCCVPFVYSIRKCEGEKYAPNYLEKKNYMKIMIKSIHIHRKIVLNRTAKGNFIHNSCVNISRSASSPFLVLVDFVLPTLHSFVFMFLGMRVCECCGIMAIARWKIYHRQIHFTAIQARQFPRIFNLFFLLIFSLLRWKQFTNCVCVSACRSHFAHW